MKRTAVRRTALAASAATLALLATACGGDSDGDDKAKGAGTTKSAEATPSASAAPAAAKPLTAAELEKALLTQADVKSGKITVKLDKDDDVSPEQVKSDKADCTPLARLQAGTYVGKPVASAKRKWEDAPKKAAGATEEEQMYASLDLAESVFTLASYSDGGAEQVLKDITAAAQKCAGGYTHTETDEPLKVTKVAVGTAPKAGDEALAVDVTLDLGDGVSGTAHHVVVRKGATVVFFPTINVGAMLSGKDYTFPTAVLDSQVAKLG
ncbi:hypothetical protein MTQ10_01125 [Streptomyces sp. XM83C]|uniref:Lipoprotein n=1 Tax=Streptomyces thermocoprophilus TaxID=78356 RepID=A0ABV5VA54_9ACTN|nr:hypothetical protein [Streptomyces sp. XM83C]MCK1818237.1 hypothetical protein [Streptomyces sp. XM83C]